MAVGLHQGKVALPRWRVVLGGSEDVGKMARYNLNDRLTGERVTIHNGEGEKEPIQQQPAVADSLVECYPNPTYFEAQWGKNWGKHKKLASSC